ncbi:MAG: hypothetical protein J6M95_03020, partial [Bacilli bacterium]|nr:hypothetical protein [Bacilli bacterium]
LIRDNTETPVANPSLPLIKKYDSENYSVDINSLVNDIKDGDQIVINGAFSGFDMDHETKFGFNISKSVFLFNSSSNSWVLNLSLDDLKINAETELNHYVNKDNYDEEEYTQIQTIIANAINEIKAATTKEEVNSLLIATKNDVDNVKTTLDKIKDVAINEVNQYKEDELDSYRQDEQNDIASLKTSAIELINQATNQEEINSVVIDLKVKIDSLKTKAQYEKEELDDAKENAEDEIRNHYAAVMENDQYSGEELSAFNEATVKAMDDVEKATSIEEVNRILNAYLETYKIQKHEAPTNNGCGGTILSSSILLSSLAILMASILIIKKYKYTKEK